jgi:hypothetical protein
LSEFEFTLTIALASPDADVDDLVERLGDAGCDDAVVGIGRRGRLALGFTREAEDAPQAVMGAIADAARAIPDGTLVEAAPDYVGLSDIASLLHVSRQNMRKMLVLGDAFALQPLHVGHPTIWRLAEVLQYLRDERAYAVPPGLVDVALITMQVNIAVDARHADRGIQRAMSGLLGVPGAPRKHAQWRRATRNARS